MNIIAFIRSGSSCGEKWSRGCVGAFIIVDNLSRFGMQLYPEDNI